MKPTLERCPRRVAILTAGRCPLCGLLVDQDGLEDAAGGGRQDDEEADAGRGRGDRSPAS